MGQICATSSHAAEDPDVAVAAPPRVSPEEYEDLAESHVISGIPDVWSEGTVWVKDLNDYVHDPNATGPPEDPDIQFIVDRPNPASPSQQHDAAGSSAEASNAASSGASRNANSSQGGDDDGVQTVLHQAPGRQHSLRHRTSGDPQFARHSSDSVSFAPTNGSTACSITRGASGSTAVSSPDGAGHRSPATTQAGQVANVGTTPTTTTTTTTTTAPSPVRDASPSDLTMETRRSPIDGRQSVVTPAGEPALPRYTPTVGVEDVGRPAASTGATTTTAASTGATTTAPATTTSAGATPAVEPVDGSSTAQTTARPAVVTTDGHISADLAGMDVVSSPTATRVPDTDLDEALSPRAGDVDVHGNDDRRKKNDVHHPRDVQRAVPASHGDTKDQEDPVSSQARTSATSETRVVGKVDSRGRLVREDPQDQCLDYHVLWGRVAGDTDHQHTTLFPAVSVESVDRLHRKLRCSCTWFVVFLVFWVLAAAAAGVILFMPVDWFEFETSLVVDGYFWFDYACAALVLVSLCLWLWMGCFVREIKGVWAPVVATDAVFHAQNDHHQDSLLPRLGPAVLSKPLTTHFATDDAQFAHRARLFHAWESQVLRRTVTHRAQYRRRGVQGGLDDCLACQVKVALASRQAYSEVYTAPVLHSSCCVFDQRSEIARFRAAGMEEPEDGGERFWRELEQSAVVMGGVPQSDDEDAEEGVAGAAAAVLTAEDSVYVESLARAYAQAMYQRAVTGVPTTRQLDRLKEGGSGDVDISKSSRRNSRMGEPERVMSAGDLGVVTLTPRESSFQEFQHSKIPGTEDATTNTITTSSDSGKQARGDVNAVSTLPGQIPQAQATVRPVGVGALEIADGGVVGDRSRFLPIWIKCLHAELNSQGHALPSTRVRQQWASEQPGQVEHRKTLIEPTTPSWAPMQSVFCTVELGSRSGMSLTRDLPVRVGEMQTEYAHSASSLQEKGSTQTIWSYRWSHQGFKHGQVTSLADRRGLLQLSRVYQEHITVAPHLQQALIRVWGVTRDPHKKLRVWLVGQCVVDVAKRGEQLEHVDGRRSVSQHTRGSGQQHPFPLESEVSKGPRVLKMQLDLKRRVLAEGEQEEQKDEGDRSLPRVVDTGTLTFLVAFARDSSRRAAVTPRNLTDITSPVRTPRALAEAKDQGGSPHTPVMDLSGHSAVAGVEKSGKQVRYISPLHPVRRAGESSVTDTPLSAVRSSDVQLVTDKTFAHSVSPRVNSRYAPPPPPPRTPLARPCPPCGQQQQGGAARLCTTTASPPPPPPVPAFIAVPPGSEAEPGHLPEAWKSPIAYLLRAPNMPDHLRYRLALHAASMPGIRLAFACWLGLLSGLGMAAACVYDQVWREVEMEFPRSGFSLALGGAGLLLCLFVLLVMFPLLSAVQNTYGGTSCGATGRCVGRILCCAGALCCRSAAGTRQPWWIMSAVDTSLRSVMRARLHLRSLTVLMLLCAPASVELLLRWRRGDYDALDQSLFYYTAALFGGVCLLVVLLLWTAEHSTVLPHYSPAQATRLIGAAGALGWRLGIHAQLQAQGQSDDPRGPESLPPQFSQVNKRLREGGGRLNADQASTVVQYAAQFGYGSDEQGQDQELPPGVEGMKGRVSRCRCSCASFWLSCALVLALGLAGALGYSCFYFVKTEALDRGSGMGTWAMLGLGVSCGLMALTLLFTVGVVWVLALWSCCRRRAAGPGSAQWTNWNAQPTQADVTEGQTHGDKSGGGDQHDGDSDATPMVPPETDSLVVLAHCMDVLSAQRYALFAPRVGQYAVTMRRPEATAALINIVK